jgi:DNA-directed RNA polymerase I and III subunit RPAC2
MTTVNDPPKPHPVELAIKFDEALGDNAVNFGTFVISHEDHTLGNTLRYMLVKDPAVDFCGYSVPHPLEPHLNIRVQTNGQVTAVDAMKRALKNVKELTKIVSSEFELQIAVHNEKTAAKNAEKRK